MNAAEKLAREIMRVTELRCLYQQTQREADQRGYKVNTQFVTTLMASALENACKAAGTNDAIEVLSALKGLEGFEK